MSNEKKVPEPSEKNTAARQFNPDGGEDEGSDPHGSDEGHLREDQKSPRRKSSDPAQQVSEDDPNKAEKLTKAGRDIDPDGASD